MDYVGVVWAQRAWCIGSCNGRTLWRLCCESLFTEAYLYQSSTLASIHKLTAVIVDVPMDAFCGKGAFDSPPIIRFLRFRLAYIWSH